MRNLVKKLSGYSIFSAVALILGFIRELVVASSFGLSHELDVFVAIMGFHLFFGVQVGNALENAFVSKVAKLDGNHHVVENFTSSLYGLIIVNCIIGALLISISDNLIKFIFPQFNDQQLALSDFLLDCFAITILLANISGLMRGGLNVLRDFSPGFLSGSIISICSIASVLLFSAEMGINALILGFMLGNFFVFLFFGVRLSRKCSFSGILKFSNVFGPKLFYIWSAAAIVLIGEVFFQATTMTERSLASLIQVGTISSFFYASALVMVPLALIVVPATTIIFPRLTEAFGRNREEGERLLRDFGMYVLLFSVLLVIILATSSDYLINMVYVRGRFSVEDGHRTAAILSIIAFSLPALSVSRLLTYSFYALSDYRTPVYGHLVQWLILLSLGVNFVPTYGAKGLAISSVVAVTCATLLMFMLLKRKLRHG